MKTSDHVPGDAQDGQPATVTPLLEPAAPREREEAPPHALVVPLDHAVGEALAALRDADVLPAKRCLLGFPHPCGTNGHRLREYAEVRETLAHRVRVWHTSRRWCPKGDTRSPGQARQAARRVPEG